MEELFMPLFSSHAPRCLILTKSHKLAVPEAALRRPFDELELSDELEYQPPTFHHFFGGEIRAPTAGAFSRANSRRGIP